MNGAIEMQMGLTESFRRSPLLQISSEEAREKLPHSRLELREKSETTGAAINHFLSLFEKFSTEDLKQCSTQIRAPHLSQRQADRMCQSMEGLRRTEPKIEVA